MYEGRSSKKETGTSTLIWLEIEENFFQGKKYGQFSTNFTKKVFGWCYLLLHKSQFLKDATAYP